MLEVHPMHAPVRGWRDFLVHIAIIVVGLCVAVGLSFGINLDLHILFQIRKCATEWTRERGMVRFKEGTDAFIVECVGARSDKEGLTDVYSKEAY